MLYALLGDTDAREGLQDPFSAEMVPEKAKGPKAVCVFEETSLHSIMPAILLAFRP
jgi:hypothetical protein